MADHSLHAENVDDLIASVVQQSVLLTGMQEPPTVVLSPYRFNPLGAHIDHQGGAVLARCLNQYTVLVFWPSDSESSVIFADVLPGPWQRCEFLPGELSSEYGWDAMARAAVAAFSASHRLQRGIQAVVTGTLVSGGLSSSASVILAYLNALANANDVVLTPKAMVELCRQVENNYRGLNNGIQDQMSIAYGKKNHLAVLDVEQVDAELIGDPANVEQVCFLMCYSGVSRDLAGSPFNARVTQCQQAAALLSPGANHLGQVPLSRRGEDALNALPEILSRRARHVYTEMQRVSSGAQAWAAGDWQTFGQLMNASCHSSIHDYESGSEWLIALHNIASRLPGVHGNRFSGGGYGGCLFMLVDTESVQQVAHSLLAQYLARYPDLRGKARIVVAESESTVRFVQT